jgi:hypothetical protein
MALIMTRTIAAFLFLVLCAGQSSADTKQFLCFGRGEASALKLVPVKVITHAQESSEGKTHQAGTSTIGSVGSMTFYVFWDATTSGMSIVRKDDDGFEAWATSSSEGVVMLQVKKKGENESTVGCAAMKQQ